jgi:simple sugar transport system ATP-binding protein
VLLRVDKTEAHPGEVYLAVEKLNVVDGKGVHRVKDVSFDVRGGEIVGIAGVAGNGQSELLEALAGIRPIASGRIVLKGTEIASAGFAEPAKSLRLLGLRHVPEDRQRMGLVLSFDAGESGILGDHEDRAFTGPVLMDWGAVVTDVGRRMRDYDVRPAEPRQRMSAFSGGNQQKIVLARELDHSPDVLLVGQPTRGVDVGAIEFIHRRLIAMRDAGKAILLVSVELDEIMSLSDRILVMFDGGIIGATDGAEASERNLGLMMAGERPAAEAGTEAGR